MRHSLNDAGFQRHMHACNNAALPGGRSPFLLGDQPVGWVSDRIASALDGLPDIRRTEGSVVLRDGGNLPEIARNLSERGLFRWRGEAFDVRARPGGPVLAQIDRGAIPSFGIQAVGVHLNGLVRQDKRLHLWIARRAMDKLLDPGKLDHIVAGGVPAGLSPQETLVKEAAEEAEIPPALASKAVQMGTIEYAMERPEGLRRDILYCYDLIVPESFTPRAVDGEVEAFELWPIERAVDVVRNTDDFKFNVNLVLIDLFLRTGVLDLP